MKIAVIYYSLTGNCEFVANKLKDKLNADVYRITPKKKYPDRGFKKFYWGGKSALMEETPELEDYSIDLTKYDKVILGFPVWASTLAPPIRTYIMDNKERLFEKRISLFVCYGGAGAKKAIEKTKVLLNNQTIENELILTDPKVKLDQNEEKEFNNFCIKMKESL